MARLASCGGVRSAQPEAAALRQATQEEADRFRETARKDAETAAAQLEKARELQRSVEAAGTIVKAAQDLRLVSSEIASKALADTTLQGIIAGKVTPIPQGTIAFFALDRCPTEAGWTEFEPLRGRYAVGVPASGQAGLLVGQALTNGESRPAGARLHQYEYQRTVGANVGSGAGPVAAGKDYDRFSVKGEAGLALARAGDEQLKSGTNAPYVQLLACRKG